MKPKSIRSVKQARIHGKKIGFPFIGSQRSDKPINIAQHFIPARQISRIGRSRGPCTDTQSNVSGSPVSTSLLHKEFHEIAQMRHKSNTKANEELKNVVAKAHEERNKCAAGRGKFNVIVDDQRSNVDSMDLVSLKKFIDTDKTPLHRSRRTAQRMRRA